MRTAREFFGGYAVPGAQIYAEVQIRRINPVPSKNDDPLHPFFAGASIFQLDEAEIAIFSLLQEVRACKGGTFRE